MSLRNTMFVLLIVFGLPAACSAGPIEFQLTPTGFWADPDQPAIAAGLYPTFTGGTYTVDPATGAATAVGPLARFDATRLPQPQPTDIHPDGTTFWRNSGYFRLDLRLTDVASGEYADLSIWGRAHAGGNYANGAWSDSGTFYWFGSSEHLQFATLGGKEYFLWGQQKFTAEEPTLSVWVGPNPPVPWVPEPGTFALVTLGLAPLGLRRLRRIW